MFSLNLYKNGLNSEDAHLEILGNQLDQNCPWGVWDNSDYKTDIRTSPYLRMWLVKEDICLLTVLDKHDPELCAYVARNHPDRVHELYNPSIACIRTGIMNGMVLRDFNYKIFHDSTIPILTVMYGSYNDLPQSLQTEHLWNLAFLSGSKSIGPATNVHSDCIRKNILKRLDYLV